MKRKIRKFRGGGMDASKADFKSPSTNKSVSVNSGNDGNKTTKSASTKTYKASKNIFKGANRDVPYKKPFGYKAAIAANLLGVGPITTVGNLAAKQSYKSRQKFATKEGLARDFYKTEGKALKPNSPIGKDYLKSAGYRKNKISPVFGGGNDSSTILPLEVTKPVDPLLIKPKENFFNFVAYKVGGLSGGVSYGPPPKKGPNPQVPPIKMKKGGYKK
jgi:hypothetical protein